MWENIPYRKLRDDRSDRLTKLSRIIELVEETEATRILAWHKDGYLCQQELVIRAMPERFSNFDVFFNDFDFEGIPQSTEAFCDFLNGNHIFAREYLGFSDNRLQNCDTPASTVLPHECGHVIAGHRRIVSSRTRSQSGRTHRRLAHSTRVLSGPVDYLRYYSEARSNADLEEEADIVGVALQVPVFELDGSLSIPDIAKAYRVPDWVAYYAALLTKDYRRAKLVKPIA